MTLSDLPDEGFDEHPSTAERVRQRTWGGSLRWPSTAAATLLIGTFVLRGMAEHNAGTPEGEEHLFLATDVGRFLGVIMIASLVSWIAYLVSRRGVVAANFGFVLIVLFSILGQFAAIGNDESRERRQKVDAELQAMRRDSLAALEEAVHGDSLEAPPLTEIMDRQLEGFERMGEGARGEEHAVFEAGAQTLATLKRPAADYEAALNEFLSSDIFDLAGLDSVEAIDRNIKAVERFRDANQAFRDQAVELPKFFREHLTEAGLSKRRINQHVGAFREGVRLDVITEMRGQDETMGLASLDILQLLRDDFGQWELLPDETVVFDSDESALRYQAAIDTINRESDAQAALQEKILEEKRREVERGR